MAWNRGPELRQGSGEVRGWRRCGRLRGKRARRNSGGAQEKHSPFQGELGRIIRKLFQMLFSDGDVISKWLMLGHGVLLVILTWLEESARSAKPSVTLRRPVRVFSSSFMCRE